MDATPLETIALWLDEARASSSRRNPLAMALASASPDGRPSVRMVLAKDFDRDAGHITFYTHFASRKGEQLAARPYAAAAFYWEEFGGRQLRIEGPVTRAPDAVADRYFATRPAASQINAWVSEQSKPLHEPDRLQSDATAKMDEFGIDAAALAAARPADIRRPAHWGGFQLWVEQVEFWTEGTGRFHQRVSCRRSPEAVQALRSGADVWQVTRLQP